MNIETGTRDYEPIWGRQLREAAEKILVLKNAQQQRREASLGREYEDASVTEWPTIKNETVGK